MGFVAQIALDGATFAFDKLYTYSIPQNLERLAVAGSRVLVPFGRSNLKKQGMIFGIKAGETTSLKSIISVMDKTPVLSEEMIKLCEYMHESYFCTYYDAVHTALPTGLNYRLINYYSANEEFSSFNLLGEEEKEVYNYLMSKGEKDETHLIKQLSVSKELLDALAEKDAVILNRDPKRRMNDATEKWVKLGIEPDAIDNIKLTKRQKEVALLVKDVGSISVKEIRYFTGVSPSVIEGLIEKEILVSFNRQVLKPAVAVASRKCEEINLTSEQQIAFDGILSKYNEQSGNVSLLYGITGSGKTQVFLKLVDKVILDNRGVIIMVPEISLTPQMLSIFTERYGNKVAVFHSAMSVGKRMSEWQRIKNGDALIALGTRSAVFAPFSNLGLIIIDEEQEHTYKSEQSPRFHARDLAVFRAKYNKGLLCLASATPSVESYTLAKMGKYSLFELKNRYAGAVLPLVETVDMRNEIADGNSSNISRRLYDAVNEALSNKNQVILLLNRRGHNTYISCPECGYVMICPNCSISLTYHSANNRLMCHYCGHSVSVDSKCPECGNEHMKFLGVGTQKAEDELKSLFPNARILRLDADSTLARDSYAEYLNAFKNGDYDILLGTQMVAKGLDFPNVTLVGVLGADSAAFSEDFRSFERSFSLLTQVVGRAGRGEARGRAIIQTINPENSILELAAKQDYDGFYSEEILTRKLMVYPPYCDICVLSVRSYMRKDAETAINGIFTEIKEKINNEYSDIKLIILGPALAAIPVVNNKYRFRMIIKCRNNKRFRDMLREVLKIKLPASVNAIVDINPENII